MLFLKYNDDLESARNVGAELANKKYSPIITGKYSWRVWAVPKTKTGKIDHQTDLTGDDLKNFVNSDLFDVLEFVKYALKPVTRTKRAYTSRSIIETEIEAKQLDLLTS